MFDSEERSSAPIKFTKPLRSIAPHRGRREVVRQRPKGVTVSEDILQAKSGRALSRFTSRNLLPCQGLTCATSSPWSPAVRATCSAADACEARVESSFQLGKRSRGRGPSPSWRCRQAAVFRGRPPRGPAAAKFDRSNFSGMVSFPPRIASHMVCLQIPFVRKSRQEQSKKCEVLEG